MNTATELSRPGLSPTVPMPRMRAEPFASVPVEETSSDGASWLSARMSLAPVFCSDSDVTALTAIGTSERGLARRVAVMMIVPLFAWSPGWAASAAPLFGLSFWTAPLAAVVESCCGAGCAGGVLFWPKAGVARAASPADISHIDLRI